jgi:hypothetical protein
MIKIPPFVSSPSVSDGEDTHLEEEPCLGFYVLPLSSASAIASYGLAEEFYLHDRVRGDSPSYLLQAVDLQKIQSPSIWRLFRS